MHFFRFSSWFLIALVLLGRPSRADDFTELFAFGDTRDLPAFYQLVLTPNGSTDFYAACRTTAASPVIPDEVDPISLIDDGSLTVSLSGGVTIPFFGTNYASFHINANGNVSFSSPDSSHLGTLANHFAQPRISAAFTDLWQSPVTPGSPAGFIGWKDLGDRIAVIYLGVPHRQDEGDPTDMSIEMYHSGPQVGTIRITAYSLDALPDAADVVVGVSKGGGTPTGFSESDLSAYPLCGSIPETAELFTGAGGSETVDLANKTLCFVYGNSTTGYSVSRADNIMAFPTDPTGGTQLALLDDGSSSINSSSHVGLHGASYASVNVNANGWLTMPSGNGTFTESLDGFFAQPAVAALWHDLDPSQGGTISWKEAAGKLAVTWQDVPDQLSGATNSFQIEMYQDGSGRVDITYLDLGTTAALVGLSSGPGSTPAAFAERDLSAATLKNPIPANADFGDLPDGGMGQAPGDYLTEFSDGGPSHVLSAGTHLGATVDADTDGQPNERANGDDVDTDGDDDDGVVFLHPIQEGYHADIQVSVGSAGFLNAWIDLDGDGIFAGIDERIANDLFVNGGMTTLNLAVGPAGIGDLLYARFRFTSDDPGGLLGPGGAWANGEVEDYALGSISGLAWLDDGAGAGAEGNGLRDETPVRAVPDVVVTLQTAGGTPITDRLGHPITTTTDHTGAYRFTGLRAGGYLVNFNAGALPITAINASANDQVDSDINASGTTAAVVVVDEGRAVKFVDAGYLPPTIEFPSTANFITEADTGLTAPIPMATPIPFDVEIPLNYGGTATSGTDYTPSPGNLVIPANTDLSSSAFGIATLLDDALDEDAETLTVTLGTPSFGKLGSAKTFTYTIIDNDAPPTVSVAPASADEDDPSGLLTFTVSLDAASGRDVEVTYDILIGTATLDAGPGGDFLGGPGSFTIPAGQTTLSVSLPLNDDLLDEDNETLLLELTGATNATLSTTNNLALGTILDNDPPPTLSLSPGAALESIPGGMEFQLTLDKPSGRSVTPSFTTSPDTATSPSDFTALTNTVVSIPTGQTTGTVTVSLVNDNEIEGEETFTLFTAAHPTHMGTPFATGRILDPSTMSSTAKYAWGSTTGWQNWNSEPDAGVVIGETVLSGHVWCSTTGRIHLGDGSPANGIAYANNSATDFGVNHASDGQLTGYAWSPTTGWIVFEQAQGKPKISRQTGVFTGHAWCATTGWLSLGSLQASSIAIIDTDRDGIDDGWERTHFNNMLSKANATSDADADGVPDRGEWIGGTNPNDGTVYPSLTRKSQVGNQVTLTLDTNPNRRYSIEVNPGLNSVDWIDSGLSVFSPDPGLTTTKTVTIPAGKTRYFFRLCPRTLAVP